MSAVQAEAGTTVPLPGLALQEVGRAVPPGCCRTLVENHCMKLRQHSSNSLLGPPNLGVMEGHPQSRKG